MFVVGFGVDVGLLFVLVWNNLELEIVLVVVSDGWLVGVMFGNDVNLCDIEGCLVLLFGKCKDNNGLCVIGLFVWLFDDGFMFDGVC